MPLGLYTACEVSAPCGLCSSHGIIGLLDVPDTFLDPARMSAGLLWFTRGFVEYQFPNNAKLSWAATSRSLEFVDGAVLGGARNFGRTGRRTSRSRSTGSTSAPGPRPGDFGDKRGVYTPGLVEAEGQPVRQAEVFRVTPRAPSSTGSRSRPVTLPDLTSTDHRSIRLTIAVRDDAHHPGGINIFGRGFGNYDQDIVLRLTAR